MSLEYLADSFRLTVRDDGRGFVAESTATESHQPFRAGGHERAGGTARRRAERIEWPWSGHRDIVVRAWARRSIAPKQPQTAGIISMNSRTPEYACCAWTTTRCSSKASRRSSRIRMTCRWSVRPRPARMPWCSTGSRGRTSRSWICGCRIIDGITAMAAIRREFADARVMMLTTFEGDVEIQRALAAGARGYMLKTSAPKESAGRHPRHPFRPQAHSRRDCDQPGGEAGRGAIERARDRRAARACRGSSQQGHRRDTC